MSVRIQSARQPVAAVQLPDTCRQSPSSPRDAQRGPPTPVSTKGKLLVSWHIQQKLHVTHHAG
jgi:hypothetical protein